MAITTAPQQHQQPSRKGKNAWRKNIDITEIQQGLEEVREAEIHGGLLSEKASEEIFAVDKIGSEDITRRYKLRKPLKVDEILARRSAIDSVDNKKRSSAGVTDGIFEPASKRRKDGWVTKKEVRRLQDLVKSNSALDHLVVEETNPSLDLWEERSESASKTLEYIPKSRSKLPPSSLQRPPVYLTETGQPLAAVAVPNAGTSYNPTFDDWDSLLLTQGKKEIDLERKRQEQAAIQADKQARIAESAAEAQRTEDAGNESAWEGFETETEDVESIAKKRSRRKTPAEQNKAKRKLEAARLAKHEGKRRSRETSATNTALTKVSDDLTLQTAPTTSKPALSRRKHVLSAAIPPETLELVLPEELQDSLRRLKPEGNLLNDRFRQILLNGKMEARKPIQHPPRRRKVTLTEKWAYKDFDLVA